jgi:hypothetical protein
VFLAEATSRSFDVIRGETASAAYAHETLVYEQGRVDVIGGVFEGAMESVHVSTSSVTKQAQRTN